MTLLCDFGMEKTMDDVYNLIQTISKLPEIYLGRRSVERLYAFLCGYLYRNNQRMDTGCLNDFTDYVAKRFQISSDHNWAAIIAFYAANEQDEWALFMKLFEEYTSERRK